MTAPDHHDEIAVPELSRFADREWLVHAHHTASRDYDKALMTLARGGLDVSIAFIRDIVPDPNTKWLLGTGWLSIRRGAIDRTVRLEQLGGLVAGAFLCGNRWNGFAKQDALVDCWRRQH